MQEENKMETAEAIPKANTVIYPLSPGKFNNYAELLSKKGNVERALKNFKQAVAVA